MAKYEQTLCWQCLNTDRFKCPWFNPDNPQPVPGWVAELRPKSMIGESYMVKECPKFEPRPKREACTPGVPRKKKPKHEKPTRKEYQRKEYPPGYCPGVRLIGRRWGARITRKGKVYCLGYFNTEEEATAARRAAEEAIARGEEPRRREPPVKKPPAETPPPAKLPEKKPNDKRAVRGVRHGKRHWTAHIKHEGKVYHLGYFKTEEKAIAARLAAEKAIKRGEMPAR